MQEMLQISIIDRTLKMTNLKLQQHLPGANKLSVSIKHIQEVHMVITMLAYGLTLNGARPSSSTRMTEVGSMILKFSSDPDECSRHFESC